jgi:hypothetical protein
VGIDLTYADFLGGIVNVTFVADSNWLAADLGLPYRVAVTTGVQERGHAGLIEYDRK